MRGSNVSFSTLRSMAVACEEQAAATVNAITDLRKLEIWMGGGRWFSFVIISFWAVALIVNYRTWECLTRFRPEERSPGCFQSANLWLFLLLLRQQHKTFILYPVVYVGKTIEKSNLTLSEVFLVLLVVVNAGCQTQSNKWWATQTSRTYHLPLLIGRLVGCW